MCDFEFRTECEVCPLFRKTFSGKNANRNRNQLLTLDTARTRPWTVAEENRLISGYKWGDSITDMALEFERTYNSVACKVGELKRKGRM